MTETGESASDSSLKLDRLRIDRSAPEPSGRLRRPLMWLILIAIVGGGAFVYFFVDFWGSEEAIEVRVETVRMTSGAAAGPSVLDASGYVVARRMATVSSEVTGKVVEVLIEEGMRVKQGDLLARLEDDIPRAQFELSESRLEAGRAAIREIDVNVEQAMLDLERITALVDRGLVSTSEFDQARLNLDALHARRERTLEEIVVAERELVIQQRYLADMAIRAPFDGVVVAKTAQPGEMISPVSAGGGFTRTGICTIVDMASLEVEVDVNEAYINRVEPGQPVEVTLNAWPDDRYTAETIAIVPTADRSKATVRVRIGFLDRDERVLPDMGVRVAFLEESIQVTESATEPRLTVPAGALVRDGGSSFVVGYRDGLAQRVDVELGQTRASRTEVVSGLVAGDRVVLNPPDALTEAARGGLAVEVTLTQGS